MLDITELTQKYETYLKSKEFTQLLNELDMIVSGTLTALIDNAVKQHVFHCVLTQTKKPFTLILSPQSIQQEIFKKAQYIYGLDASTFKKEKEILGQYLFAISSENKELAQRCQNCIVTTILNYKNVLTIHFVDTMSNYHSINETQLHELIFKGTTQINDEIIIALAFTL